MQIVVPIFKPTHRDSQKKSEFNIQGTLIEK